MNVKTNTVIDSTSTYVSDWFSLLPMDAVAHGMRPDMASKELEYIERASDNLIDIITGGMAAIGDLQWHACTNPDRQPEISTFIDLATLQKTFAELLEHLHTLSGTAASALHQRELEEEKQPS